MREYYKRVGAVLWRDFAKSTREHVIGALLAVAIIALQIHYGVITTGDIRGNAWAIAWPYVTLISCLFLIHLVRAPYKLDMERKRELETLKEQIAEQYAKIERLTWPEDRPKLTIERWGQNILDANNQMDASANGFHVCNDGSPALEVTVSPFTLTDIRVVSATVSRIGERGFIPILLPDEVAVVRYALDIALGKTREKMIEEKKLDGSDPLIVPLCLNYRDSNGVWYHTRCDLKFTHRPNYIDTERFEFTAPKQERGHYDN